MAIVDSVLTKAQEIRNNILGSGVSLQSVTGLTSGGILSKFTGTSGILSARTSLLQSRISAMNVQTSPIEKVKSFLNPVTPSFIPQFTSSSGGILSSLGISAPTFARPTSILPKTIPTSTTAKQIMLLPPVPTTPTASVSSSTTLFA